MRRGRAAGVVAGVCTVVCAAAWSAGGRAATAGTGGAPPTAPEPPAALAYDARDVRPGDVLFRRGDSFASRLVLGADPVSPYSHVGVVALDAGRLVVVHAALGEGRGPGGEGASDVVVAEPLARFLAPGAARAAAVYRLRSGAADTAAAAAGAALALARARVPFDLDFDLETPGRLYCTELVWRAYRAAGVELLGVPREALPGKPNGRPVILPSHLLRSPSLARRAEWGAEWHAGPAPHLARPPEDP